MDPNSNPPKPRFVSSALSLGAYNVVGLILGLIGTSLIARYFSTEDFGIYAFALVLVSFLSQISTFGLDLAISKFIAGAKEEETKERYFSTAITIRIVAIIIGCLLVIFGEPLLAWIFGQSVQPTILPYIPLLFGLENLRILLKSVLQGCLIFNRIGISDLINSSTFFILILVIIVGIKGNITHLILVKVASTFLACIFAFISIPIKKTIGCHADTFKELIRFGFPLQINDFLGFIFLRIDTIVVAALLGPSEIALYEVARKIPDYLRNLYEPFRSVYYPNIANRYTSENQGAAQKFLMDSVRFVAFVTLFGTAISIVFGREIITMLFSEKYASSTPAFILLMFNLSIALTSNVMGTTLVAIGDTKKPMIINIFNAIASWLGSMAFVPILRLIGAAIGNTLGTAISFPLNVLFLRKRIDFKNTPYLKPLALFGLWSLAALLIQPTSIWLKGLFLIIFLMAGFLLSIVTKTDIALLIESSGLASRSVFRKLGLWLTKS